jgi:hypothetical protein
MYIINFLNEQQKVAIQEQIDKFGLVLVSNAVTKEQYIINKANNKKALLVVKPDGSLWLCRGMRQNHKDWDNFTEWLTKLNDYLVIVPNNLWSDECAKGTHNHPFNLLLFLEKHKIEETKIVRAINVFNQKYKLLSDMPLKAMKSSYLSILKEKELV